MSTGWSLPWDGGCRCGQLRIRVSAPPLMASACHCTGCQRMTGGAYALSLTVPSDGFAVMAGEPVIGGLHGPTRHYHCRHCLSWVFTRPDGVDFVNLRAGMLDEAQWFAPFVEMWCSEKLPFAETGAAHSYAEETPLSDYPGLIAAYQTSGARPG